MKRAAKKVTTAEFLETKKKPAMEVNEVSIDAELVEECRTHFPIRYKKAIDAIRETEIKLLNATFNLKQLAAKLDLHYRSTQTKSTETSVKQAVESNSDYKILAETKLELECQLLQDKSELDYLLMRERMISHLVAINK